jgi:glucose/arabinose dehydrogenase
MRRLASPAALLVLAVALVLAGCGGGGKKRTSTPPSTATTPPATTTTDEQKLARNPGGPKVETLATGLEVPWEIGFLPDGRALITERPGRVRLLLPDGKLSAQAVANVDVLAEGEGGLLGLAVDPDFENNSFVYLYRTTSRGNEVARYRLDGTRLREQAVVAQDIPAGQIHDGGRIRFGPDQRLYISTGEAGQGSRAQDPNSLGGKFLTLTPDAYRGAGGEPQIFSSGHRNPQGFDWEPKTGRLLSTEHGPSGNDGPHGFDELNLVRQGGNYGWPDVYGHQHGAFIAPIAVYDQAIAPSGGSFVTKPGSAWTGDFIFGALVGEQIRRVRLKGNRVVINEPLFQGKYGRIRDVVEGPDGALYALTSNRDGRGSPRPGDDRLLRIVPPAG